MGLVWLKAGQAPDAHSTASRSADIFVRLVMGVAMEPADRNVHAPQERADRNVRAPLEETVVEQREMRAFCRPTSPIFISSRVGGSGRSPGSGCCQFVPQQTRAGTLRYHPFTGDLSACVIVNAREHGRNRVLLSITINGKGVKP